MNMYFLAFELGKKTTRGYFFPVGHSYKDTPD